MPDGQLIKNADKIRHIPATIVQGRYDLVCPFETAWQLHKVLIMFSRFNYYFSTNSKIMNI